MKSLIYITVIFMSIAATCAAVESKVTNTSLSGPYVCTKRVVYLGTALETFLIRQTVRKRCLIGSFIDVLKKKCRRKYYVVYVTKIGTRTVKRKMTKIIKYCCYGYREVKGTCEKDIRLIVLWVVLPILSIIVTVLTICLCWCLCCKKCIAKRKTQDENHNETSKQQPTSDKLSYVKMSHGKGNGYSNKCAKV